MSLEHNGLHAGSMRPSFSTHGSNVYPSVDAIYELTASTWQEVVGARRLHQPLPTHSQPLASH
ncbi:hypothetical protein BDZ89DRAFT_1066879, partial [Hymenopellis radicata]